MIDIAAGNLRLRYEPDAEGKLRQIGFRVSPEGAIPEDGSPITRGPFPGTARFGTWCSSATCSG